MTHASISTLLSRLMRKGVVARQKGDIGKAFVFRAAVEPFPIQRHLVGDLLDRVFGGSGVARWRRSCSHAVQQRKSLTNLAPRRRTSQAEEPLRAGKRQSGPREGKGQVMRDFTDSSRKIAEIAWLHLVHASWQSALVGIVVLTLVLVGRRWPAPFCYSPLTVALVKFLIPPFLAISCGLFSWLGPRVVPPRSDTLLIQTQLPTTPSAAPSVAEIDQNPRFRRTGRQHGREDVEVRRSRRRFPKSTRRKPQATPHRVCPQLCRASTRSLRQPHSSRHQPVIRGLS